MRIFYGSLLQETNTFCPVLTDVDTFRHGYALEDAQIAERLGSTNTEIAGFLAHFSGKDAQLLPGIACWAVASGKITDAAYEELTQKLLQKLAQAMPVDGVFLALHGAMVSESLDDCEGDLLQKVRAVVGETVPIAVSLDYHANMTQKMVHTADAMVGFRTYPHVDFEETGRKAAALLERMIRTGERFETVYRKLPLVVPVEDAETGKGLCREILDQLDEAEKSPEVLSTSLFCSQPWLDIEEAGVSLLLYLKAGTDPEPWQQKEKALAQEIWARKDEFYGDYPDITKALELAAAAEKPVILVDSGDITTAGGIGDSTVSLRALLHTNLRAALCMVSAKAVAQAWQAGEGAQIDVTIGGEQDYGYNQDVTLSAKVMCLKHEPSKITGKSFSGIQADSGRRAYLKVGENLHIVAAEYAALMYDPQFLRDMGVEPADMDVIVQKSHKLFRAAYQNIAKTILIMDTPGFTDKNLVRLPFRKLPRPIYPLDHFNDDIL